jgi:hypothetical protein
VQVSPSLPETDVDPILIRRHLSGLAPPDESVTYLQRDGTAAAGEIMQERKLLLLGKRKGNPGYENLRSCKACRCPVGHPIDLD